MTEQERLDREAIRHLLSSYIVAVDRGRLDDVLKVYTPDVVFELGPMTLNGREAIRAEYGPMAAAAKAQPSTARRIGPRHHITTSHVEFAGPDRATGRTYFLIIQAHGMDKDGAFIDEFRKIDGQWLISHRQVREHWLSEQALAREVGH